MSTDHPICHFCGTTDSVRLSANHWSDRQTVTRIHVCDGQACRAQLVTRRPRAPQTAPRRRRQPTMVGDVGGWAAAAQLSRVAR